MRAFSLVFMGLGVFAFGGCDSCSKPETTTAPVPSASVAAKPSASTAPSAAPAESAAAAAPDAGAHPMTNCPTVVSGAETTIKDVEGGVEVSVTAKDDAATKEIRDRAKKLLEADKMDAGTHAQHNGSGMGGGMTGRCTIILRNTKLASAEIPGGVKVTVQPKDKSELEWLRRKTRENDAEAKSKDSVGAGAKRMAHCPSAIEGAKTAVKDAKDGVVVTITGPADKVAEIRERAKHTADVAKKAEAAKITHSGEGTGGGGIGRCPIVVEGDTSVDLKEIPAGVEATVTTKKDVPALQKEAKERAANFK